MTTQKWAEALARELLHTPKRERANLIIRRVAEQHQRCFCSYCGHETDLSGMTVEQKNEALLDHVVQCPKRPELKFLNACIAAAELVEAYQDFLKPLAPSTVIADEFHRLDTAVVNLQAALDELKPKPKETVA